MGNLAAMIGEHRVKGVRHPSHEMAPALGRHRLDGLRVERGLRARRRAVEGDQPGALAVCGTHRGEIDGAGAERSGLARLLRRLVALEAIIQRQQRRPAKRPAECRFRLRQDRRMGLFRSPRGRMDRRPFLPWREGLGMKGIPCCQRR
jgi:hypothetical protein